MKKLLLLSLLATGLITLSACGSKEKAENTTEISEMQSEADAGTKTVTTSEEPEKEIQARLSETGDDMTKNPVFDPYNAYASLGKNQKEFIKVASETDEYQLYEYDDYDAHVYAKGLSDYFTDSYSSYLQLWTKKGSSTPYKISYVDSYKGDSAKQFAEDFEFLDIAFENAYGVPVAVGYVDKEGNINQGSIDELIRDIDQINNSDGGFAFVEYDSGDISVSLNATYDPSEDIYTIFIDIE